MTEQLTRGVLFRASSLLVAFLLLVSYTIGGTRTSFAGGSGGGVDPNPPLLQPSPPGPVLGSHPAVTLRLPLLVGITGTLPSYNVVVTSPTQGVIASGTTNAQGLVMLKVTGDPALELTVIGTSVVGLPVHGGQALEITIP